mgnify:CR=1 FL=1
MRIPNIYTDSALSEQEETQLNGQTAQHLVKVLRMKSGDKMRLFNNSGYFYSAHIVDATKKSVSVQVTEKELSTSESTITTHLGQVMSRGDRMDYAIQKSTEMGVSEITPLMSERCELRLNSERELKRISHWQQVAINAAEQCGRAFVPKINPIETVENWVKSRKGDLSLVLHHRDSQRLDQIKEKPKSIDLLIGPEGGLSEVEIELAIKSNFTPCTFGPRVMRTETAPVACLSILQWLWGDFQS